MDITVSRRVWTQLRGQASWLGRAWELGQNLRPATSRSGQLLVVGTAAFEPWHITAHLDDEARREAVPSLSPTLLRFQPPATVAPHLRHSIEELRQAGKRQTILVVAPDACHEQLLQMLTDASTRGANIFAVTSSSSELANLTDDCVITPTDEDAPHHGFSTATHLLSVSAGTTSNYSRR